MKRLWLIVLALGFGACVPANSGSIQMPGSGSRTGALPDLGPAPELTNSIWLNTAGPLRLVDLRGKVVGLEMWTFACVNCQHVMPYLKAWYAKYRQQGFLLIGNHYPEFSYEADLKNLQAAVVQDGIEYPVAQDNDGSTWSAYHNIYWPTLYLIDKGGHIRYVHIGEGGYDEIEANIRALLAEPYPQD